jgi:ethanolamine permease
MSKNQQVEPANSHLDRKLGPLMLWGLGVGYVISGMYFGWNLGLPEGGTLGMAIATFFVTIMYAAFTFSYTELACAIPKAGGAFDYAKKAYGSEVGFISGMAQLIEFLFAPPAIAAAIGAYFHEFLPSIPTTTIALVVFAIFTAINIFGVKLSASFELVITVFAVVELLVFGAVTLPSFHWSNLAINAYPKGASGILAAIPYAIWFFLAIEGVANVAEETIDPQKNVVKGFGTAIITLIILCILTFIASIGVGGWEAIVYPSPGADPSDSPLPLALAHVVGKDNGLYHLLLTIGLFGLVASFNGILLVAGRAMMEFGRVGFFPAAVGKTHQKFHTPAIALIVNMLVGIAALLSGKTGEIIVISVFGALTLYVISMLSLFKLRKTHPNLERPFRVPLYPFSPAIALVIAVISLLSMIYYNVQLFVIYLGFMVLAYLWFHFFVSAEKKLHAEQN